MSLCFVTFQNSVDDEFVISTARKCNKYTDKLVIFDARSMFAAGGNMLKVRDTLKDQTHIFLKLDLTQAIFDAFLAAM